MTTMTREQLKEKWFKLVVNCEPTDRSAAEGAFEKIYWRLGIKQPQIIWFNSPASMMRYCATDGFADRLSRTKTITEREFRMNVEPKDLQVLNLYETGGWNKIGLVIQSEMWTARHEWTNNNETAARSITEVLRRIQSGQFDIEWLAATDSQSFARLLGWLEPHVELAKQVSWYFCTKDFVLAVRKPKYVRIDSERRLHEECAPAVEYDDGWSVYAWQGVRIDTPHMVHQDDCGSLFDIGTRTGPVRMVRVTNCTAEPNGTFKQYYIPVAPHVKTAREAVAWTFFMDAENYHPSVQT